MYMPRYARDISRNVPRIARDLLKTNFQSLFVLLISYEALAKLTNFGSSVFAFGYAVTGRTDTTGELLHIY